MTLSKDDRLIQSFEDPYLVTSTSGGHIDQKKSNDSLWSRMSLFQRLFALLCCVWLIVLTGLCYSDKYPVAANYFHTVASTPFGDMVQDSYSTQGQWDQIDIYWNWGGKPLACLLFFGIYIVPMLQLTHWIAVLFFPLSQYRRNNMIQGLKKAARFSMAAIFLGFTEVFYVKWDGHIEDPPITVDFTLRNGPKPGTSVSCVTFFCLIIALDFFDQTHQKLFDFKPHNYGKSYVKLLMCTLAFIFIFLGFSGNYLRIKVSGMIGMLIKQTDIRQSIFDWTTQAKDIHGEAEYNFWYFLIIICLLAIPLISMFMKILTFWCGENERFMFVWRRLVMFYMYDILVLLFLLRAVTGPQQDDYFTEVVKPPPCFSPQHPMPEGMKCQKTDCSLEPGWYWMLASAICYYFGDVYLYLRHCCNKKKDQYEIENYVEP